LRKTPNFSPKIGKNRRKFRRKLAKIAEICDPNIDPRSSVLLGKGSWPRHCAAPVEASPPVVGSRCRRTKRPTSFFGYDDDLPDAKSLRKTRSKKLSKAEEKADDEDLAEKLEEIPKVTKNCD
jgi:hypothetical protein